MCLLKNACILIEIPLMIENECTHVYSHTLKEIHQKP